MKKSEVKISNAIIDACYHPDSLYQMRLLLAAIAQVPRNKEITHETEFEISAAGIADLIGVSDRSGSLYGHLKRAADELMRNQITVYEHHDGRKRDKRYTKINFVSHCIYLEDEAKVFLQFTHSIIPYISQLQGRHATYMLSTALKMKSGYGIRLYEICQRWAFRKVWELHVDEFRHTLGLEDKYPSVSELKRWVINPAIRDVNEHTEFTVIFGQKKSGRTITTLQFHIEKDEGMEIRAKAKATKSAASLPDGTIPVPKDFDAYARAVLPISSLGHLPNDYQSRKALRAEMEEGTVRDRKTGKIIQRRWKPIKPK